MYGVYTIWEPYCCVGAFVSSPGVPHASSIQIDESSTTCLGGGVAAVYDVQSHRLPRCSSGRGVRGHTWSLFCAEGECKQTFTPRDRRCFTVRFVLMINFGGKGRRVEEAARFCLP